MPISELLKKKAAKLFLHFSEKDQLEYCRSTKSYFLRNPKSNFCHPLELLLISDHNFTGDKILDIRSLLKVSYRWLLGFQHGYTGKVKKYKNSEYSEGFFEGENAKSQNRDKPE